MKYVYIALATFALVWLCCAFYPGVAKVAFMAGTFPITWAMFLAVILFFVGYKVVSDLHTQ